MSLDIPALMDTAVEAAALAAQDIMQVYGEANFDIQLKSDNSPVTRADILAHHLIKDQLLQADPQIPVLSEESRAFDWPFRKNWPRYWLVDPLDGTKEFVDRNGEFSINIALIENNKPIIGVVYAPVSGDVYFGAHGLGAFKNTCSESNTPINVRSVHIDNGRPKFTVVIGRGCIGKELQLMLTKLPEHQLIRLGSALKTCLIAEGKADVYPRFGNTSEWDTAAGQCILECAGGGVYDMHLLPLQYNTKESLLNPNFLAIGDTSISWNAYL